MHIERQSSPESPYLGHRQALLDFSELLERLATFMPQQKEGQLIVILKNGSPLPALHSSTCKQVFK